MASQHALAWKLGSLKPDLLTEDPEPGSSSGNGDAAGLLHDRDVTVFYGDPKWEARLAAGSLRWKETLVEDPPGDFTWTITPQAGKETFAPVDTNGSQRGGRPLVLLLPRRFDSIKLLEGDAWKPMPGDDFILLPNPGAETAPPDKIVIRFRGK
jgi:zinc protease